MDNAPQVGDKIKTWVSNQPDGLSTILEVRPYTGKYRDEFEWIVKVTAPRTKAGWIEMAMTRDDARCTRRGTE